MYVNFENPAIWDIKQIMNLHLNLHLNTASSLALKMVIPRTQKIYSHDPGNPAQNLVLKTNISRTQIRNLSLAEIYLKKTQHNGSSQDFRISQQNLQKAIWRHNMKGMLYSFGWYTSFALQLLYIFFNYERKKCKIISL